MSWTGTPSVMQPLEEYRIHGFIDGIRTISAGTKMTDASAPVISHGWSHWIKTGIFPSSTHSRLCRGWLQPQYWSCIGTFAENEITFITGNPLDEEFCILCARMLMIFFPFASETANCAAWARVSAEVKLAFCKICCPSAWLVPIKRTTIGILIFKSFEASKIPLATSSQRVIPPKMLIKIDFDLMVAEDDLEWGSHFFWCSPPRYPKISCFTAKQVEDIHGCHG